MRGIFQAESTPSGRADALLNILCRCDDKKVDLFLKCLSKCRQNDLRDVIVSRDDEILGTFFSQVDIFARNAVGALTCDSPSEGLFVIAFMFLQGRTDIGHTKTVYPFATK